MAVEGPQHYSFYRDRGRIRSPAKDQLRFDITTHDVENTPPKCTWRDDSRPLGRQATDIVRGIFPRAEDDSRKWALENHTWRVQERPRKATEAKLAAEKAEADRIAREKAETAARIQRLLDGADALERAARIRRYVVAVKAENAALPEPASAEALNAWAEWALGQANSIDPVASRRFLKDVGQ